LIHSLYDDIELTKYFKVSDELKSTINSEFIADFCTQSEQSETIRSVYQKTGYLIDPHTAVAKRIAEKVLKEKQNPILIACTAHYAKFPESVLQALDEKCSDNLEELVFQLKQLNTKTVFHLEIEKILDKKILHTEVLERDLNDIKNKILEISKLI
jgi:threonine synthase